MKFDVGGNATYCYTNNREIDPLKKASYHSRCRYGSHGMDTFAARHFARHGPAT